LRKEILQKLEKLPSELREKKSRKITERVTALPEWKEAEIVLAFLPMPEEVDTTGLIRRALEEGKTVGVPRMGAGSSMEFHAIPSLDGPWEDHPYGVREPAANLPVIELGAAGGRAGAEEGAASCGAGRTEKSAEGPESAGKILVLTPGLAFDRGLNRLGRGKGFYDAYLSRFSGHLAPIGLAFALQIVDEVPVDPADVPLEGIVTEEETLHGGRR
jgi:5-formyltetrahydrofolate cyclo-ligase